MQVHKLFWNKTIGMKMELFCGNQRVWFSLRVGEVGVALVAEEYGVKGSGLRLIDSKRL